MTYFEDLPNEVISQILSLVYSQCFKDRALQIRREPRLKPLLDIALVSHLLHANAEKFIYQIVNIGFASQKRKNKRPWNFLRTILARPHLRVYVKTLNVRWSTETNHKATRTERKLFEAAAQKVGLDISIKSEGHQVQLLSHLLPNVEELYISYSVDPVLDDDPFMLLRDYSLPLSGRSTSPAVATAPTLSAVGVQNIRALTILPRGRIGSYCIIPLLLLPNLRTLTAYHVHSNRQSSPDEPPRAIWNGTSTVTKLCFLNSELHEQSLSRILQITPKLIHFEYEDSYDRYDYDKFRRPEFQEALKPVRPRIQHITINLNYLPVRGSENDFCSLRDFPALRSIKCNFGIYAKQNLCNMLPSVLEEFESRFEWQTCRCFHQLENIMRERYLFPNLAAVRIYPEGNSWQSGKSHIEMLQQYAKEAGVRVGVARKFGEELRYHYS